MSDIRDKLWQSMVQCGDYHYCIEKCPVSNFSVLITIKDIM